MPTVKIAIYKNRRGQYKDILLWCNANRGICRIDPVFVTNYNYEIINIEDLKSMLFHQKKKVLLIRRKINGARRRNRNNT